MRKIIEKKENWKNYWDDCGKKYSEGWKNGLLSELSKKENDFIQKYFKQSLKKKVLDIGVGNGRILNNYILIDGAEEIYGLDYAESMIDFCKNKFHNENKVKGLKRCDVSMEEIPFDFGFDFISAVRVLKYSSNWMEILKKISKKLNDNGLFVFTMPNKHSITSLNKYFLTNETKQNRTTIKELRDVLGMIGFDIIEITSFTKLPDIFYQLSKNKYYAKLILFIEKLLEILFGDKFLGRFFFVAVKNKS
ncbi:MAG: methyltransferase domain-containing protein [Patescibacteria group bacterium]|jgi:SAM-dependent methyltransferase